MLKTGLLSVCVAFYFQKLQSQNVFPCFFDSSLIELKTEKINTASSEYAPCFFRDGIIFSSNRDYSFGIETYNAADKTRLDDLYFSSIGKDSLLDSPEYLKNFNTRFQEGTSCYDSLSKTMYYTSTIKIKGKMVLTIYRSKLSPAGDWGTPEVVITPKKAYSIFHPCLTNNGNTLIFGSDEFSKTRGSDLFTSNYIGGVWTEPLPMSNMINTDKNDGYPFVDPFGNLFFASKGHPGYGGYDVFFSENINGVFQRPVNLGMPVNSPFDDFSLIVDPAKRFGYFSTNRFQEKNDDILRFNILFPLFRNCNDYLTPAYCYDFSEENSLSGEDTAGFFFEWNFGDGQKSRGITVNHCFAKTGNYNVELNIFDNSTGQLFMNQLNYDLIVEEAQTLHIKCPDTAYIGDMVDFDSKGSVLPGYTIQNYFWNFPNGYMTKNPTATQLFNKEGKYEVKLGVTATKNNAPKEEILTFCITKFISILPAGLKSLVVKNKEVNTFIGKLKDFGTSVFDLSRVKDPEYSVYLGSSDQKVDMNTLLVDNPGNIKVIYEDSLYRYLYSSKKTMKEIIQEYIKVRDWGYTKAFVVVLSRDSLVSNQLNPQNDFSVRYKNPADLSLKDRPDSVQGNVIRNNTVLIVVNNDSVNDPDIQDKKTTVSGMGPRVTLTPDLKPADKDNDGKISVAEINKAIDAFFDGAGDFKLGELYRLVDLKNSGLSAFPKWMDTSVVFFGFNEYNMPGDNNAAIRKAIDQYKNGTVSDFVLIGFADSVGSQEYNLQLSQKRCKTIQDYLAMNGIVKAKMKSFWYGEDIPPAYKTFIRKLSLSRCVLIIPRVIKSVSN